MTPIAVEGKNFVTLIKVKIEKTYRTIAFQDTRCRSMLGGVDIQDLQWATDHAFLIVGMHRSAGIVGRSHHGEKEVNWSAR